ncbi:MAG: TIGR02646 family protein [Methylococcaceae bacterium]|nr:TIGR02646 family protein [Methylococcaceae bacterium]
MRKISKSNEPDELTKWKRKNKNARYNDLEKSTEGIEARQEINQKNITDQLGLCGYCCKRISDSNSMNEHIIPRSVNHSTELDFNNIIASCNTKKQCDKAHDSQYLPLTPLMDECETELKFFLSGKVEGKTKRANEAIRVLNLNNRILQKTRKQFIYNLLITEGMPPEDLLDLQDNELLNLLITGFKNPKGDFLDPFSPIIINILQSYLSPA